MPPPPPVPEPRWPLGLLAVAYLGFVVYGSLVPLHYTPVPWEQALARWEAIPFLALGIGSRADWVANLLLFVPLAFLWLGWLWPRRSVAGRVLVSLLLWGALVGLSLAVELTQIFFPPRTVSQNDILAESLGGIVGILAWWWFGPALWRWVLRWREARGVTSVAEYLLLVWVAGLFLYNVLPLDLTISPVEIYHKWQGGGVHFIPFSHPVAGPVELAYALAVDAVLWLPVSLLWVLSGRRRPAAAFRWTMGAALLLELLQFFVYSRVSDSTDLITAAAGAAAGALIGSRLRGVATGGSEEGAGSGRRQLAPWALVGVVVWTGVVCAVFWYPYDFTSDGAVLRERLQLLYAVPFRNYYYGTEFRAVTELLHKLLFFAPLGVLLALVRFSIRRFSPLRPLWDLVALGLVLGVPALIELGQVALPGKYPDSTDWMLEAAGAAAGYVLAILVRNRLVLRPPVAGPGTGSAPQGRRGTAARRGGGRAGVSGAGRRQVAPGGR